MDLRIDPAPLRGAVTPPPSKSQAHRLLLCAALARGESVVDRVALSQDIQATLGCMEALGASWTWEGEGRLRITGCPLDRSFQALPQMDCGESGSTLRFLIPVALAVAGGGVFTGRGRLMQRPQQPYFDLFDRLGIFYRQEGDTLRVEGRLTPGRYELPGNVSSQFFTGLLYALSLLGGPSTVVSTTPLESADYIRMTVRALEQGGVRVEEGEGGRSFRVLPGAIRPLRGEVEADWSQAGFWYAARALGNEVTVTGMDPDSPQGDRVVVQHFQLLTRPGDVTINVSHCPDLVPPLAAMAALRRGETRLINAARLRMKESDRLASVTAALNALGGDVEEGPDSLTIRGKELLEGGGTVDCCNDHRIAMMAAIAATRCRRPAVLLGADCVKKSYPDFWEEYKRLGGKTDVVLFG